MVRIGLISDTHGYLDPAIHSLFLGVNHILHAGDIGDSWIIQELQGIAPVTAVLGNNDLGLAFRETEEFSWESTKFLIHHIVTPERARATIGKRFEMAPDVVVFGHTHQRFDQSIGSCRFINPGYSGKKRTGQERTVAIAELGDAGWNTRFISL